MKKTLFVIFACLCAAACGAHGSKTSEEPATTAPVQAAKAKGKADAGMAYIKHFYQVADTVTIEELDVLVARNITAKARKILQEANEFDCADGDCLAIYLLFHESGVDIGYIQRTEVARTTGDNYHVTLYYSVYPYDGTFYRYDLNIGLAKVGNGYKIDNISNCKGEFINAIGGATSGNDYVSRYLDEMNRLASDYEHTDITFFEYTLVDVDNDGTAEILARMEDITFAFAVGGGKPQLLFCCYGNGDLVFYEHAVGYQASCGTCCHAGTYAVLKNSRPVAIYSLADQYDINDGETLVPDECSYMKDDQEISIEEGKRIFEEGGALGHPTHVSLNWRETPGAVG